MFCTIAYDIKLKRPGCVLLQTVMGATISNSKLHAFPQGSWLLAPTPDLKLYPVDDERMLRKLILLTRTAE